MSDVSIFPISTRPLPAGFQEAGFDGNAGFTPAFDDRHGQAGIGSLRLTFWLRGPGGAVSWETSTGCYLSETQTEWLDKLGWNTNKPSAGAVDWHSPSPLPYASEPRLDCLLLGPGIPCYGDSGYLLGNQAYEALVTGGEPALWAFLKEMYDHWFAGTGTPSAEEPS